MKKTLALVLALLMVVVALVACGTPAASDSPSDTESSAAPSESSATPSESESDGESSAPAGTPLNIGVMVKGTESDFWQYMIIGAEQYQKDYPDRVKLTIQGPPKELDLDEYVNLLEAMIETEPVGIVMASNSSDAPVGQVEKAYELGIKIVVADNAINTDSYDAFLATDNIAGGALAADSLVEAMEANGKTSGRVFVMSSSGGSQVMEARHKGFVDQMESKYTQYTLHDEIMFCENDMAKAISITETMFKANTDIVGVFGANNMSGSGVTKHFADSGIEGVAVVCYDSDPVQIENMQKGIVSALIVQDPAGFGYKGVDLVYQMVANGYDPSAEFSDKYVDTGCIKITADNYAANEAYVDPRLIQDGTGTRTWPTYGSGEF